MERYKQEFIEFMVECEALRFGDFTTKSGRRAPYFINSGRYGTGAQLDRLSSFYAAAIQENLAREFDVLFGPAYKGIPLAVATAIKLNQLGHDVGFCFNRKEQKDHGEGGMLVGARLGQGTRVLIIEDVTTAGTSVRESVPLLRETAAIALAGLVVSVDRMERGTGESSALTELSQAFGMKTFAIATIEEILEHLRGRAIGGRVVLDDADHARVMDYRAKYGAH